MKSRIHEAVAQALRDLGADTVGFNVEYPGTPAHGDYATNAAMTAASELRKQPAAVAELLKPALEQLPFVDRVAVAGPGFLNIFLARSCFTDYVSEALTAGEQWGAGTAESGREVLIEYGSPNLFKQLHVGNLVGVIVGESLARLFSFSGAVVRRITYPSDVGLTVAKAVWGLTRTNGDPGDIDALNEAYRTGAAAYDAGADARAAIDRVNAGLYTGDAGLTELKEAGKATSLRHIENLCRTLGTIFDTVIYESEAAPVGLAFVREHLSDGIFEEDAGAVIFRGERHGLHTRVFVNSAGLPTYEAKDIGNFSIKQRRYPGWDLSLVVTGTEQRDYFQVIHAALREMFDLDGQSLEHVTTGFLTLAGGKKMSSRTGDVLTGETVLAELRREAMGRATSMRAPDTEALSGQIAVGALKYWILRQHAGSDISFDMEQAFSFEGDSGPYLQYAHARAASVLAHAAENGITPSTDAPNGAVCPPETLLHRFGETTRSALEKRSPHHLATYLITLAGSFNAWYAHERIADASDVHAPYKVAVTRAVRQTLKNGLYLLGIPAPEHM